ncbi:MAG: ArnT family glycosyltransferase [Chloroflexota bacterium]
MRALVTNPSRSDVIARWLPRTTSLPGLLYAVLIASAACYLVAFVVVAVLRLSYPFPLEITEGAVLRGVERVLHGQALYVPPTLEHVPYIYGPVYFYLSAAVASATGASYLPLRLVSLAASMGSLALIARLVQRETGSSAAGVVAAGLLAATFPLAQTSLDLGRVDAVFVFFLVAGVYLARAGSQPARSSWFMAAASGCCIALAGLTKVPMGAAPVALALGLYVLVTGRGQVLGFVLGLVLPLAAVVLLLRAQSGPWPTWYLWDLPRQHEIRESLLGRFWFTDVLPRFSLPLLLGPVYVLCRGLDRDWRPLLLYGLTSLSFIGLAWPSRASSGGALNVLLPAFALMALLLGLGFHATLGQIGRASARAQAFRGYVLGACIVQFALLAYNPRLTVPYLSDQWADERLVARLADLPGPVFAPDLDGYLRGSSRPDTGEQPHNGAVEEIMGGYGGSITEEGLRWRAELTNAFSQHRFRSIVLFEVEDECCGLRKPVLASGYRDAGPLFAAGDDFFRWKTTHGHTPEVHLYVAPE